MKTNPYVKAFGPNYRFGNHLFICEWEGKQDCMALINGSTLHRHAGPADLAIAQFARQFGKPTSVHRFTSAEEAHKAFPQVYRAPAKPPITMEKMEALKRTICETPKP
jgi:hypothetical protein